MSEKSKYDLSGSDFKGATLNFESLINGSVKEKDVNKVISELSEWKNIHNESQLILNSLNMPMNFITKYRFSNNYEWLEEAGYEWQKNCFQKVKNIPDKWKLTIAHSPLFEDLKNFTSQFRLKEITRQFMQPDISKNEFRILLGSFKELYGMIWDLLTISDKRILVLVEHIKTINGN